MAACYGLCPPGPRGRDDPTHRVWGSLMTPAALQSRASYCEDAPFIPQEAIIAYDNKHKQVTQQSNGRLAVKTIGATGMVCLRSASSRSEIFLAVSFLLPPSLPLWFT